MRHETARARLTFLSGWQRLALAVWVLLLTGICLRASVKVNEGGVFSLYVNSARSWVAGEDPYHAKGNANDVYRYSPPATVLLVPFALCPAPSGRILWQLLNFLVFLGGFAWWLRAAVPASRGYSRNQA